MQHNLIVLVVVMVEEATVDAMMAVATVDATAEVMRYIMIQQWQSL